MLLDDTVIQRVPNTERRSPRLTTEEKLEVRPARVHLRLDLLPTGGPAKLSLTASEVRHDHRTPDFSGVRRSRVRTIIMASDSIVSCPAARQLRQLRQFRPPWVLLIPWTSRDVPWGELEWTIINLQRTRLRTDEVLFHGDHDVIIQTSYCYDSTKTSQKQLYGV